MNAIVCRGFGPVEQLRLEDIAPFPLHAGQVRVQVHAAGVNYPDALRVQGLYQIRPALPWVPGSEVAGLVLEAGSQVQTLRVGARVMGITDAKGGGFAEEVVLDASRVLSLPDDVGLEEAAATPVVYGTTLYALRQRARLQSGETLLVLGAAGGVGLAAVQLGKVLGARVIAAASTEAKRNLARECGADEVIDYTQPDWRLHVKALTGERGVDIVYDPVGGDYFDEAVRCVGWGGRYLVVGFTAGRIPRLPINLPLVKGYDLIGVRYDVWRDGWWPLARANLQQVIDWQGEGRFRPWVSARFPLAQAVEVRITARRTAPAPIALFCCHSRSLRVIVASLYVT